MSEDAADFRIAYDGTWYHDGAPIQRHALAKLFADKGLKIDEEGRYWLQSPFEKYPVEVEDVPFIVVDYEDHEGRIDLRTNMDEIVELGASYPLELRTDPSGQSLPYVHVRDGLYARLSRSVYYLMVDAYGVQVKSRGAAYALGVMDE